MCSKKQPDQDTIWFAATDANVEGLWVNDGIPLVYMNWVAGEPNDGSDGQDCAVINHDIVNGLGRWDDAGCDQPFPYVCELGKHIFYNIG